LNTAKHKNILRLLIAFLLVLLVVSAVHLFNTFRSYDTLSGVESVNEKSSMPDVEHPNVNTTESLTGSKPENESAYTLNNENQKQEQEKEKEKAPKESNDSMDPIIIEKEKAQSVKGTASGKQFVLKSFLPVLDEDWLVEKQKDYDQERAEAIALAKSRNWPLDSENLFVRGVQEDRLLYYQVENTNAAISTGANLVRNTSPYFVNGTGINVGVWDGGAVMPTHQEVTGRVTVKDGSANHYHATHVGGTIIGNGAYAPALGMAPSATIDSYDWNSDITEMGSRGARTPGDTGRIQISNHSYGVISGWTYDTGSFSGNTGWHWLTNISTLTDKFFGQYNSEAASMDEVAYNAPYYLIFKSAGNDRSDGPVNGETVYYWNGAWQSIVYNNASHPKGDGEYKSGYDTIPTAGNAKNIITVGAVYDAVLSGNRNLSQATMSTFSGWGPTDDGRIKPDVVGNGVGLVSAHSSGTNIYASLSGTSMSSPNITGSTALILDYFDNLFVGHMMRASTIKSLIIATADDIGPAGPDYQNGWGLMNTKKAIDLISDYATSPGNKMIVEGRLDSTTNTSDAWVYESDGLSPFIATISWTDPKGTSTNSTDSTTSRLVNNLNLRVLAPDGSTYYYPYVLDGSNPSTLATTGVNNIDNTELVRIASPVAGLYTVKVEYSNTLTGGSQYYSLIMQGVKKNVDNGLPLPVSYTLGTTSGGLQEIHIYGSNFLLGANTIFRKSGNSDVVLTKQQVTPEYIKGWIPENTILALDWEIRVTNPDGKMGSTLPVPKSKISNISNGSVLTGVNFTILGTSTTNGQPVTSVKIIIDDVTEVQAINTGTNFSTWSYVWALPVEDGTINHTIKTIAYTANFQEQSPTTLTSISIDTIAPAILVSVNTNTTTEAGGFAIVSVNLQKKPTNNVVLNFSSSLTSEGTLSKNQMTFTPVNWKTIQTLNVIGVDDLIQDGNINYSVVIHPASSSDVAYHGVDPADISFTNIDDDTANIIVTGSNLVVSEGSSTANFQVRLATQPSADVTINLVSSDITEGTISASSIVFNSSNWMNNVTVTVTGVDDAIIDGDIDFLINFTSITSGDANYNGLSVSSINVKCLDNENAGLIVNYTGLESTEGGLSNSLQLTLSSQPTGTVTYALTSSATSQVSFSANSVSFNGSDWNQAKNIVVTAINDHLDEDDLAISIYFGPAISSDIRYNGNVNSLAYTIKDNDTSNIIVSAMSGNLQENGINGSFTIVLQCQPTHSVTIDLTSSNTDEAILPISTFIFTDQNWNIPKTVAVHSVDDGVIDGDISLTINGTLTTNDLKYQVVLFPPVTVINVDDEVPSIVVTVSDNLVSEAGKSITALISLKIAPLNDVTVPIQSSDTTEGLVSPSSLIFTTSNWSTPQIVTITGVDDFVEDGNVSFLLLTGSATSADNTYHGVNGPNKVIINIDNDDQTPPIVTLNGSAELTIRLGGEYIELGATAIDAKEGNVSSNVVISGSVNPFSLGAQTISYFASDSKGNMSSAVTRTIHVVNTAGLNIPIKDYLINENGGKDSITISLKDAPKSNVVVLCKIVGLGANVTPQSLTFNSSNWNQNQTVFVNAINDDRVLEMTGTISVEIDKPNSESNYSIVPNVLINYVIKEDDENGFDLSTRTINFSENLGAAEVLVALRSEPTSIVNIEVGNSDNNRLNISSKLLAFNKENWKQKQKVIISSINNDSPRANPNQTIRFSIGNGSDSGYLTLNSDQKIKEIQVVQVNEDVANFIVNNKNLLIGPSLSDSFSIKLISQPVDPVKLNLNSLIENIKINKPFIEFSSDNWGNEQIVTVSGTSSSNLISNIIISVDPTSDLDFINIASQSISVEVISSEDDLKQIVVENNAGGTVSPSGAFIGKVGSNVAFTVQPADGYEIERIFINGVEAAKLMKFSVGIVSDLFIKVFFVQKSLIPIAEGSKPKPSEEEKIAILQLNSATEPIDTKLEIILMLSKLQLTETEKAEVLLSLNNITLLPMKNIEIPLMSLINLQTSLKTESDQLAVLLILKNLTQNTTFTSDQNSQLVKIINSLLVDSNNDFKKTNQDAIEAVLLKLQLQHLMSLKNSSSVKNEILLEQIKMISEKLSLSDTAEKFFSSSTGASECYFPKSLFVQLKNSGHSVIFLNEVYSPYSANTFSDILMIPISDITKIEILDNDLSQIRINNLLEPIVIKIPVRIGEVVSLKSNEFIQPMFYNKQTQKWSKVGITLIEQSDTFITLQVTHLTSFALFKATKESSDVIEPGDGANPTTNPVSGISDNSGGGGGGCSYGLSRPFGVSDLFYVLIFGLFLYYRRKK